MGLLLVALLMGQGELVAPPPMPEAPALDAQAYVTFFDQRLLSLARVDGETRVRSKRASFKLSDDDFPKAFALVPELKARAEAFQAEFATANALSIVGITCSAVAAVAAVLSIVIPVARLGLLIGAGVLLVGALIVSLVSIFQNDAVTKKLFELVEDHNRALLRMQPPLPVPPAG